jgi:hypothetical protein
MIMERATTGSEKANKNKKRTYTHAAKQRSVGVAGLIRCRKIIAAAALIVVDHRQHTESAAAAARTRLSVVVSTVDCVTAGEIDSRRP